MRNRSSTENPARRRGPGKSLLAAALVAGIILGVALPATAEEAAVMEENPPGAGGGGGQAPPAEPPAPPSAGYEKGFFIRSGDKFEIRFGARVQLLYQYTDPDTFMYDSMLGKTEDTTALNDFYIRRFKFNMQGYAFSPSLRYKFQLDILPFRIGGAGAGGNVRLEEAFVDVAYKPWTSVLIGQFKLPWSFEKMTSSGKLNLVDRSIVNAFFGVNQEPGAELYGISFEKHFRYDFSVTQGVSDLNGYDVLNDVAANGDNGFRYVGRVTWDPLAPYVMEEGAVGSPDKPQLTLQLGLQTNRDTIPLDVDPFMPKDAILPFGVSDVGAPSPTFSPTVIATIGQWAGVSQNRKPYNRNEIELLCAYKYRRFAVEGQAILGRVDPDLSWLQGFNNALSDLKFDNSGYRLQAGFMLIPTRLEVAGRWAQVDRKAEADFVADPTVKEEIENVEYRLGLNWYFRRHDWKWQFDIGEIKTTRSLNGVELVVPVAEANPDKLIQENPRKDKIFRSQVQFQF
jgi:hypothetical protein